MAQRNCKDATRVEGKSKPFVFKESHQNIGGTEESRVGGLIELKMN